MSLPLDGSDDLILPFAVEPLDLRGRVVRLGPSIDTMIKRHGYPEAVARVLGEAAALTALLGSSLKFEGRFQLQTRTDGPVEMIVVDFDTPDRLRAFIRFDADRVAQSVAAGRADAAHLIGHGHLAMTIDQGPSMSRYQGVVPMEGQSLEEAAHQYFRQSEQIPTRVRLAVAEQLGEGGSTWRAGGLLAQFMPASIDRQRQADLDPGDAPEGTTASHGAEAGEDDAWMEGKALVDTIADHELVDPALSSERLLYRLFHERGVRVFAGLPVREGCNCNRDRIMRMLASFSAPERRDMVREDGRIGVTCEFCSREYELSVEEVEAAVKDA
ncbi:MAG: Hsp33 family molecular chaperone [Salinarimonas sp.]|nr:Hsp33 family molecular chaperone [Salinarimonas sp.]